MFESKRDQALEKVEGFKNLAHDFTGSSDLIFRAHYEKVVRIISNRQYAYCDEGFLVGETISKRKVMLELPERLYGQFATACRVAKERFNLGDEDEFELPDFVKWEFDRVKDSDYRDCLVVVRLSGCQESTNFLADVLSALEDVHSVDGFQHIHIVAENNVTSHTLYEALKASEKAWLGTRGLGRCSVPAAYFRAPDGGEFYTEVDPREPSSLLFLSAFAADVAAIDSKEDKTWKAMSQLEHQMLTVKASF